MENMSDEDRELHKALEGLIRYQIAIDAKKRDGDVAAVEVDAAGGGE